MRIAHLLPGPAIVEQLDAATVIYPGHPAGMDAHGNLLMQIKDCFHAPIIIKTSHNLFGALIAILIFFTTSLSNAHNFQMSKANITLYDDGRYYIKIMFDLIDYMEKELKSSGNTEDIFEKIRSMPNEELDNYLLLTRNRFINELNIYSDDKIVI